MAKNKLLLVYGSRAEYIKIKPLIGKLEADTLHIGQHTNIIDFGRPNHFISVEKEEKEGRLNKIISEISLKCPTIFHEYESVLTVGDTCSVFGASLTAFHLNKRIVHLEAGLRSYNYQPYPEESYRQMVSRIANVHLCPTEYSAELLKRESVQGKIYVVGNTVLDNLVGVEPFYGDKVLVTIHRNENREKISEILVKLDMAAYDHPELEFIFPFHPNPIIEKAAKTLRNIKICPALEHKDLIEILRRCRFVCSDSAGIFEEASFLNKKTIILRETTERSEGILSGHGILCSSLADIRREVDTLSKNKNHEIFTPCPFGDGFAADKIKKILENV